MTKYFKKDEIDNHVLLKIAKDLRAGKLVVFPTDTVYGIGANAYDNNACKRIYEVKGRPMSKPLIVLVSDLSMLNALVDHITSAEQKLINTFWPGPLTIKFKKKDGILPNVVTAGDKYIAIRLINNGIAYNLIRLSGVPLVAPSANISGNPTGIKIKNIIKELGGKVDYILDYNDIENDITSTIVQVEEEKLIIIREGKIKKKELAKILPLKTE